MCMLPYIYDLWDTFCVPAAPAAEAWLVPPSPWSWSDGRTSWRNPAQSLWAKKLILLISNKLEYQCGSGVETSVPDPYLTFWDGDGSLDPYTGFRIRLRILLFSSVVFKKPKSFFFCFFLTVGTFMYISLLRPSPAGEGIGGPNSDGWRESLALCLLCATD